MPRLDGERARRKRALHRKARRKSARKSRAKYLNSLTKES